MVVSEFWFTFSWKWWADRPHLSNEMESEIVKKVDLGDFVASATPATILLHKYIYILRFLW